LPQLTLWTLVVRSRLLLQLFPIPTRLLTLMLVLRLCEEWLW
jgi:hypothetical protein